jgi:MFS family permease
MTFFLPSNRASNLCALIGVVFFSTLATSMVITVLPAFFIEKLHLSFRQIGYIEGTATFVAFISKFFAGVFSDKRRNRKNIIVLGTALSVISKIFFAFATGFITVFVIKIVDRFAKGLRSCPADAMIAEVSHSNHLGISYGMKYVFFTIGSVLGGVITSQLLKSFGDNFRFIFLLAAIPAVVAFSISKIFLTEKFEERAEADEEISKKIKVMHILASLNNEYWSFLTVIFILMFSRFSISFLGIRALELTFQVVDLPKMMILYSCSAAVAAIISAIAGVYIHKETILKISIYFHFIALSLFAISFSKLFIISGTVLSGIHIGMSQGIIHALISKFTTSINRASAFSIYYLVAGIAGFLSNKFAGDLCNFSKNATGAFYGGAFFCLVTILLLSRMRIFTPRLSSSIPPEK